MRFWQWRSIEGFWTAPHRRWIACATEAGDNGVDAAKNSNDIVFWWGNMNYFGTETLDITDSVSSTYPNLVNTQPFTILHFVRLKDSEAYQVLYDTVEVAAGAVTTTVGEGIGVLATVLPSRSIWWLWWRSRRALLRALE